MTRKATLWVTNNGLLSRAIGMNHAGLELIDGSSYTYVTWDGQGDNLRSGGAGPFGASYKGRVARRIGHPLIIDRETGRQAANPKDYTTQNRNTAAREGFNYYNNDQSDPVNTISWVDENEVEQSIHSPCYAREIPVRDESARNFANTEILWGLSIRRIEDWWHHLMSLPLNDPKRIYSKLGTMEDFDKGKGTNCCGMTALALGIGGLSAFATPPSNTVYQGSRTLIEWVEKAVKKINTLNTQRNLIRSAPEYANTIAWDTLPTFKVWEAASKVMIGWRKDQIAKIDTILKAGVPPVPQQRSSFASVLGSEQNPVLEKYAELYGHCFDHLAMKPTSDRRKAVLKLAKTLEELSFAMIGDDSEADSRLGSFSES
jgi:hypothetical protein